MFIEVYFKRYFRVCVSIKSINNVFHFIKTFFKNFSDLYETKAVQVSVSLILLVAARFCICQAHAEVKWDTIAKSNVKLLAKTST